ncbi:MAG: CPCC family cysteine-rich protein [Bacillota bacterium]|nr:CPCC family cysteine-rich protein [Bacillota bacterium]
MSIDLKNRVKCPCCGYPTLEHRAFFEICILCEWEDDGQDNSDADVVHGGPNGDYSLTEARKNFLTYTTSYRINGTRIPQPEKETIVKKELMKSYRAAMNHIGSSDEEQFCRMVAIRESRVRRTHLSKYNRYTKL